MTTLVDTSALFALVARDDRAHDAALAWLEDAASKEDERLLTHSYVVVEAIALVASRLTPATVRMLVDDVLPACEVRFVNRDLHERAMSSYLAALGRRSSFVDRTSFELMRTEGIRRAFAFDRDFAREGFETVP
jgi:predicted nucleic acid-binding protein